MPADQTFDVTSGCDLQEVDNAVNQAQKEISQRFDFRGLVVKMEYLRDEGKILLTGPTEYKPEAMWDVLRAKLVRRGVPVKNLHPGDVQAAAGSTVRQEIVLQQGIPTETAKAIVKFLKERKLKKVQASIQGDQVRISSPSRDELQAVIALLKQEDYGIELKFGNFRSS